MLPLRLPGTVSKSSDQHFPEVNVRIGLQPQEIQSRRETGSLDGGVGTDAPFEYPSPVFHAHMLDSRCGFHVWSALRFRKLVLTQCMLRLYVPVII